MRNPRLLIWALAIVTAISATLWFCTKPKIAWASQPGEWDGWKKDVVDMRSRRKQQPPAGMLHAEEVAWNQHYDVDGDALLDGRYLKISSNAAEYESVLKWEKGRKLLLCYDEERGMTIFDQATGLRLAVRSISGRHPIDDYIQSLNADSTYDMMSAGYEERRLWGLEIDRCVREVLSLKYLPDDVRAQFVELTKVRLDYCRLQSEFAGSAIHSAYAGGTIAGPACLAFSSRLYRQAYHDLADLYDSYTAFGCQPQLDEEGR